MENFKEKHFSIVEKLANRGPIAISIAPYQIPQIKDNLLKKIKEILSKDGTILGQQGLNHRCKKCIKYFKYFETKGKVYGIDPWHENYCLWFGHIPIE
ncbi:MAG: hypothetical protein AB1571_00335 [Nanoarchaeota archaeon]